MMVPSMAVVANVVDFLKSFAPLDLAAEWDNVGLIVGDPATAVERVMTCLTVTPEVVAEAVDSGVQLIVTHHPMLFRASKRITTATAEGRMLLALIRAGVAVYSPHTAFDNTRDGINDLLAKRLGLLDVSPLKRNPGVGQCKVVVFVPDKDLDKVSDAMFAAGAGRIGEYSECSFRIAGTGTFFGSDAANPTIGQKGRREEVSELRLEAICAESAVEAVVAAMRRAHSYEEPAYDVYPLRPLASSLGVGRVGRLPQAASLGDVCRTVKTQLNAGQIQCVGAAKRSITRIAIVCGAGGEFLGDAAAAGADAFLTGEMRFHDYLAAQAKNMALILPGHYASERCGVEDLARGLQKQFPALQVWASRRETDPVSFVS
jgi:dinuclear metal center YbgI/SA1388 family protein